MQTESLVLLINWLKLLLPPLPKKKQKTKHQPAAQTWQSFDDKIDSVPQKSSFLKVLVAVCWQKITRQQCRLVWFYQHESLQATKVCATVKFPTFIWFVVKPCENLYCCSSHTVRCRAQSWVCQSLVEHTRPQTPLKGSMKFPPCILSQRCIMHPGWFCERNIYCFIFLSHLAAY